MTLIMLPSGPANATLLLLHPLSHDESTVWRPRRTSALHQRIQNLGAVFGTKNGWERVNYFDPDHGWRITGEEQREWGGWVKPGFFDWVGRECRAVGEQAGMIGMSSFGKIDLKGPGALTLLQRLACNDMDRPAGTVICTQFIVRSALLKLKSEGVRQRLCTLVVGDEKYLTLYGAEAVLFEGRVISRLRSAGYGFTVKKNIGYAYLPVDMVIDKAGLEVDIFGETVSASVAQDVWCDPEGKVLKK